MAEYPKSGTNDAIHATFRLVPQVSNEQFFQSPSRNNLIGKFVKIESFNSPGKFVTPQSSNGNIIFSDSLETNSNSNFLFRVVAGLDGNMSSVSLESGIHKGCFLYSGVNYSEGSHLQLICKQKDASFKKAVSFSLISALRQYHPISFRAKGVKRDFILEPLMSMLDESYTVYFNLTN
ncbi:hypothetical protein MA16_Dca018372 [Dendrobium catenatum]|uniref:Uncharacterized protein n=3 Tax=Dendrobium catenatum TaxID=906689 RepID=A0A2I0XAU8_9ASPA|nr:hypothetical protein MA16_Dca018372 [Dendrobium catenatum]